MTKQRMWLFALVVLVPTLAWAQAERGDGGGTAMLLRDLVNEVRALRADLARTHQLELRATIVAERHHAQGDIVQRVSDQVEIAGRELAAAQDEQARASAEMQRGMTANATASNPAERAAASQHVGVAQEAWNQLSERVSTLQARQTRLTEQLAIERAKFQALDQELAGIASAVR